ncbi:MAG: hypothetical protein H6P99_751 [Holophagaceae bacterium]|nr:hypothetical protein [Holophagaceae bacterium]
MSECADSPNEAKLRAALGLALPVWLEILHHAERTYAPVSLIWRDSKTGFGQTCLLQHKKRTLLYLSPDGDQIWVAIILGDRAFRIAMSSFLPDSIKGLLADSKPYREGRGIRFPIRALEEVPSVVKLLEAKMTK